ncbi:molybdopterin-guanine dinucleotide biosynthesis protein B [Methanolacinia petrolearia DSM 11571]|uniref:Molybdopterin-guanine dinucleotide biosynthesis protein B n=1 Tax=Methanolacinia petrolearia (strain DSM 11571 / OCM 486 / SEBR 4847) TaxID=679926 RepID=E1REC6_METP4|nr:molybdopterin-guanine dinucleotide biosynthesis protein MobB [Methanolacinia petrolearia]ADN37169.1 molybdopterin-guanine dinucleotide biosynthesis protein B [Methanolacinia petrolearia DSM 11571]
MKVIQVVGRSNSGKTYFIHRLLERMTVMFPGKVGVIKHMGHHIFELSEGKDTTTHYEHGAECVAGVDAEKTVLTVRDDNLDKSLEILCDLGMKYAIIEGFKEYGFKKIVKGELESGECLLRDPTVDDVTESLDAFDDYYTLGGLVKELEEDERAPAGASIVTFSGVFENIPMDYGKIAGKIGENEGIVSVKTSLNGKKVMIGVASVDTRSACNAIDKAVSELAGMKS